MLGLSILSFFTNTITWIIFAVIGERVVRKIRLAAYKKIINMPVSWFAKE